MLHDRFRGSLRQRLRRTREWLRRSLGRLLRTA